MSDAVCKTADDRTETESARMNAWRLFGIAALALAYPTFDTFASSVPFFIAHDAGLTDLALFAAVVGYAVPVFVALGPGFAPQRVRRWMCLAAVAVLAGVYGWRSAWAQFELGWPVALVVGLSVGGAAAMLFAAKPLARFGFATLSAIALCLPPLFVWDLHGTLQGDGDSGAMPRFETQARDKPPIFVIVLDEMSTLALLDENRAIDASRFPNFGRLAEQGTWFRNGSAAAAYTGTAITALATGRQPVRSDPTPTFGQFPVNICAVLDAAGYRVFARESVTTFCPPEMNAYAGADQDSASVTAMLKDAVYIVPHIFMPAAFADRLAPMGDQWRDFDGHDVGSHHRVAAFRAFVSEMAPEPGTAYFSHFMLPHVPYEYLESGEAYDPGWFTYTRFKEGNRYQFQQYLQQAMFLDRLLGEFLDRLDTLDAFDRAFIAVVADHGVSYREGLDRRNLGADELRSDANDIVKVPFFIKFPDQRSGEIVDTPAMQTDLLPTLMSLLKVDEAETWDGVSLTHPSSRERSTYSFFVKGGNTVSHTLDILDPEYDVDWKFREFDAERGFAPRSPYDESLLFTALENVTRAGSMGGTAILYRTSGGESRDLIEGVVTPGELTDEEVYLAVGWNDRVVSIIRAHPWGEDEFRFAALLPQSDESTTDSKLRLFEVRADGTDSPELIEVSIRDENARPPG